MDTSLSHSEKRTLKNFVALYALLSFSILLLISILYLDFERDFMLRKKQVLLEEYAKELIQNLKYVHINLDKTRKYPRSENYRSAIFDSSKKLIFSTLQNKKVNLDDKLYKTENIIHFIKQPSSYYLGSYYVVVEIVDDELWLNGVYKKLFTYAGSLFFVLLIIGYFLSRLFLRPMREAIEMLERFIQDTTHELNTPISTINMNIEMLDSKALDEKSKTKIDRIKIASQTLSHLYDDLSFLLLNHKVISNDEELNLKELIEERLNYFEQIANVKKVSLNFICNKNQSILMDRKKITKLLDNLISNAIKYNKISGDVTVTLDEDSIVVKDSGQGIKKRNLKAVFDRFERFNYAQGGFGIGLHIVNVIAKEYGLNIDIESKENIGTKVSIRW